MSKNAVLMGLSFLPTLRGDAASDAASEGFCCFVFHLPALSLPVWLSACQGHRTTVSNLPFLLRPYLWTRLLLGMSLCPNGSLDRLPNCPGP